MALTQPLDVLSTSARWKRLGASIPASYTVFKHPDDSLYYAECNVIGGTAVAANANPYTLMDACALALTNGGRIYMRNGDYRVAVADTLTLQNNVHLIGESYDGVQLGSTGS